MRKKLTYLGLLLCFCLFFASCVMRSDQEYSEEVLNRRRTAYEKYLAETYPEQKFTVEVWQEYGKKGGAAGLPDYEGYLLKHIITDSEGNRFRIYEVNTGKYTDDYQKVLDGTIHYNEKGQQVFYKDDGSVWFVTD